MPTLDSPLAAKPPSFSRTFLGALISLSGFYFLFGLVLNIYQWFLLISEAQLLGRTTLFNSVMVNLVLNDIVLIATFIGLILMWKLRLLGLFLYAATVVFVIGWDIYVYGFSLWNNAFVFWVIYALWVAYILFLLAYVSVFMRYNRYLSKEV